MPLATPETCEDAWEKVFLYRDEERSEYYREFRRYGARQDHLGHGYFSVVTEGTLPKGFEANLETPPGVDWKAGDKVAVKGMRESQRDIYAGVIEHEARIASKIAEVDAKHMFNRGAFDKGADLLVLERHEGFIKLDDFLAYTRLDPRKAADSQYRTLHTGETRERIRTQMLEALKVLHSANVVHGDFKPGSIFIHPKTLEIKVFDYTLATEVGTRPAWSNGQRWGSDRYSSPNQRRNGIASFEDDVFSMGKIIDDIDLAIYRSTTWRPSF